MSTTSAPLSEADYEAIESAVMETMRGRWFLAEYGRRNRTADTRMLLSALDRIEAALRGESSVQSVDRIRFDIVEMAKTIARTKTEIAAIKPDAEHQGKFGEATDELDSIVQATEKATSDILAAAEQIQEIAWTLREQGLEAEICDMLDAKATDVYTACSFQDLTGQRTGKVIQVLNYLEQRINAMIHIWGLDGAMAAEAAERESTRQGERALLNGPALPGRGLDQGDVDLVMGPAESAAAARARTAARTEPSGAPAPSAGVAEAAPAFVRPERIEPLAEMPAPAQPDALVEPAPEAPAPVAESAGPPLQPAMESPPVAEERPVTKASFQQNDPLGSVAALSYEEKIALFT
jgi:chemotaxis regulatin CheY-phosphate phosphatase CheZ